MAVNLTGAADANIDYGDTASVDNLAAITVSLTFKVTAPGAVKYIFHKWTDTGGAQYQFLLSSDNIGGTDRVIFVVGNGAGNARGRSTDNPYSSATTYRIVCRWRASDGTIEIWLNGSNQAVSIYASLNLSIATLGTASTHLILGHEQFPVDAPDGDYSEAAIHGAYMPDDYIAAYSAGYSPNFYRKNGIFYAPLVTSPNDIWGGITGTNSGGTLGAPHSRIIMPRGPKFQRPGVAAPPFVPAFNMPMIGF